LARNFRTLSGSAAKKPAMRLLLALSRAIDAVNDLIGRSVSWLVLVVVLVSAGNAISRKFLHSGSNAWLELQWYLFGAMFLLASGYALTKNDHVRVDILAQKLSKRSQILIEIFGLLFFLFPAAILIMWFAWPMFWESWITNETSSNSGGLVRWPVKLLIPIGFCLLIAGGVSYLIKCVGFLMGRCADPTRRGEGKTAEEEFAEDLAQLAEVKLAGPAAVSAPADEPPKGR
jgi:TRAP-type mannitol/chloroaromatic compound transport system permease small subunit